MKQKFVLGSIPVFILPKNVKKYEEEDNDVILVELCDRLQEKAGVKISRATMGRITQKLNLTRKKKQYTPVNDTQSEYKNLGQSIGQLLEPLN